MDSASFWEDTRTNQHVKFETSTEGSSRICKEEQSLFRYCEGNLNFATVTTSEDDDYSYHKKKVSRDPMSHRIIEKRRRDRMNNCLADLSRLIPADYLKKGRGRVEKTEIIEMAIRHMKYLQGNACTHSDASDLSMAPPVDEHPAPIVAEHYRLGYHECLSETMHFLVEVEGFYAGDPLCVQLINHLQKHCNKILKGDQVNFPRANGGETSSSSGSSGGYQHSNIPLGTSGLSSGSPGSISDSGHTENKDSGVGSAAVMTSATGDDSGSQLREMLTGPSLMSLQHHPRTAEESQHEPSSNVAQSEAQHGSLYKFKNNIKQRFSQEHRHGGRHQRCRDDDEEEQPCASEDLSAAETTTDCAFSRHCEGKRKRYHSPDIACHQQQQQAMTKRADSDTCSVSSSPPSPGSKYPHSATPPLETSSCKTAAPPAADYPLPGIPIFALHAKGSFYVPLTLDSDILAPYLSLTGPENLVLHPVTISVNFQQTNHPRIAPRSVAHPAPTWKNEANGFAPAPKWAAMCGPDRG